VWPKLKKDKVGHRDQTGGCQGEGMDWKIGISRYKTIPALEEAKEDLIRYTFGYVLSERVENSDVCVHSVLLLK